MFLIFKQKKLNVKHKWIMLHVQYIWLMYVNMLCGGELNIPLSKALHSVRPSSSIFTRQGWRSTVFFLFRENRETPVPWIVTLGLVKIQVFLIDANYFLYHDISRPAGLYANMEFYWSPCCNYIAFSRFIEMFKICQILSLRINVSTYYLNFLDCTHEGNVFM